MAQQAHCPTRQLGSPSLPLSQQNRSSTTSMDTKHSGRAVKRLLTDAGWQEQQAKADQHTLHLRGDGSLVKQDRTRWILTTQQPSRSGSQAEVAAKQAKKQAMQGLAAVMPEAAQLL